MQVKVLLSINLVPKAGLEPARLAAPPPQDGVSANSTTSAKCYFFSGVVGGAGAFCGAGAGGCCSGGRCPAGGCWPGCAGGCCGAFCCLAPSRMTEEPPGREIKIVSASDVIIK